MSVDLKVPPLGESITEAVVGKWHKKVGDLVKADEPVVVLETDKVTIDVQAPAAGALDAITFKEGSKVKIGDTLGSINPGAAGTRAPAPVAATTPTPSATVEKLLATPVARAIAADRGIDPSSIQGTGVNGRVMKDDVVRVPVLQRPAGAREERVAMSPLRKRVAERLLQAQNNAAILTTFNELDMGEVISLRKAFGEKFEKKHGVKLGLMSFFVRATIEALKQFPTVNASIDGDDVVFHRYYDLGVAVSGSRGLVVPVLRDADRRSMADLEKGIAELGVKAKTDKLTLGDLQGGTFTISNGGIFGSMLSTPILNPPQTGILGMHNIVERAVVREGAIVIRPMMYLALSYDHRLIDGREAVQFLVRIKECLETPERMLLEI